MADVPPTLSTIDLCNTTTPNKFHIEKNAHIPMADIPPNAPSTPSVQNPTTPNLDNLLRNEETLPH